MRRITIALMLPLLISLGLVSCGQPEQSPIRLGTNIWPGYEPLYLARDLGMLSEEQIRLIEYPSASEVLRAFRNKHLDAASLTLDEVLLLAQGGIPVRVILVHDISDGADVIMARPGIDTVEALRDKRVAVESGALGAFVLTRALQLHDLSLADIHVRHLGVDTHELSYAKGDVDAAVTFDPIRTRLMHAGAREIFNSSQIPGEIADVLVVHEETYRERLPELKALIDAWFRSVDYLKDHPRDAAEHMARRLKITPDEVINSYNGLKLPSREENRALLTGPQARLFGTLDKLEQVLLEHKLMQKDVDTRQLPSGDAL